MKKRKIVSPNEIHKLAIRKGWYEERRSIPESLCLMHSEISEALEIASQFSLSCKPFHILKLEISPEKTEEIVV